MKKITFESFLNGTPATDYIRQNTPYQQQIREAAAMLREAEYVLVGAGAGLSTAGFYPYPDEESYWGYWSKQALLGGVNLDVMPLYKQLLAMLGKKKIFVLSTNVDGQFEKAGLSGEDIFCTQGDYFHIQCRRGCHARTYHAVKLFQQMDQAVVPESFGAKAVGINADMAESIRDMAKELKSFAH